LLFSFHQDVNQQPFQYRRSSGANDIMEMDTQKNALKNEKGENEQKCLEKT